MECNFSISIAVPKSKENHNIMNKVRTQVWTFLYLPLYFLNTYLEVLSCQRWRRMYLTYLCLLNLHHIFVFFLRVWQVVTHFHVHHCHRRFFSPFWGGTKVEHCSDLIIGTDSSSKSAIFCLKHCTIFNKIVHYWRLFWKFRGRWRYLQKSVIFETFLLSDHISPKIDHLKKSCSCSTSWDIGHQR